LIVFSGPATSCADGLYCAVVKQAPDGFAALRDKPTCKTDVSWQN
jgi:hypothetical protein